MRVPAAEAASAPLLEHVMQCVVHRRHALTLVDTRELSQFRSCGQRRSAIVGAPGESFGAMEGADTLAGATRGSHGAVEGGTGCPGRCH